ncbi:efflux transporter outer membrane subunit [Sphingomonas qomolangmaensis]|uniref:Efflux transporter outer membrane subunit n=1 Tax=Sphingomonas qomolangmaensis TaxID=2918765 RepID=A0ABY5L8G2_9SPHN|nr:efflux transporter outer membrane subunit [Sphingomonas qomolangmaensis]UUL82241.1 efflux transporter outer membrane subunit [Sphingomonas qomolangmaensis]
MKTLKNRWAILAAMALPIAGCSLEPSYERPGPAVPGQFPVGGPYPALPVSGAQPVRYTDIFRDPRLQTIIGRALANNQNLQVALGNVRSARGQLRSARADLLPSFTGLAGASVARNRGAAQGFGGAGGGVTQIYNASAGLTAFEIDLFGRVRSTANAALNEYLATEAGVRAARLTLVGETASAYYTLATDRSLLAIAEDTVRSAQRSVELTRARLQGGIIGRTDLRQAETILQQARADRADLTAVVAQDRNALELLVGAPVTDAELPQSIETADPLLAELPAALDSRILLARPDVVQAEYTLRAANARIGAARAQFFPSISLTGLVGFASNALGSLFTNSGFTYNGGADAGVPLFDGGFNRGNLETTQAQRDIAVAQYRLTIQTAFREVSGALARRGVIAEQYAAQLALQEAAADTFRLSDARYREGIDGFLTTLDAQRTLYGARRSLALTRLVRADNLVTLYRTLGGADLVPEASIAPPDAPRGSEVLRGER